MSGETLGLWIVGTVLALLLIMGLAFWVNSRRDKE